MVWAVQVLSQGGDVGADQVEDTTAETRVRCALPAQYASPRRAAYCLASAVCTAHDAAKAAREGDRKKLYTTSALRMQKRPCVQVLGFKLRFILGSLNLKRKLVLGAQAAHRLPADRAGAGPGARAPGHRADCGGGRGRRHLATVLRHGQPRAGARAPPRAGARARPRGGPAGLARPPARVCGRWAARRGRARRGWRLGRALGRRRGAGRQRQRGRGRPAVCAGRRAQRGAGPGGRRAGGCGGRGAQAPACRRASFHLWACHAFKGVGFVLKE